MSGLDWLEKAAERTDDNDPTIQGSKAWLEWRKKGLGGSDAAALLGWSPYITAFELWQEKIGVIKREFGPFQVKAMQRGKDLEPIIREWYEKKIGATFKEGIGICPDAPHIRASYDGINHEIENADGSKGRVLEIKAPNKDDHALAAEGLVPFKYLAQLQWMGIVSGIKWFDYVSFGTDGKYHVVAIEADPAIQAELIRRAQIMWTAIETKTADRSQFEADFKKWMIPMKPLDLTAAEAQIEDQSVEALVAETIAAQAELDQADARFQALRAKLQYILGDKEKMECGEAVFGWQTRKGSVEYAKIPEIQTVDLEKYRKDDVRAFYFKRSKK